MHFRAPKLNGTKETCHTQSAIVADHLMNLQEVLAESPDDPLGSPTETGIRFDHETWLNLQALIGMLSAKKILFDSQIEQVSPCYRLGFHYKKKLETGAWKPY